MMSETDAETEYVVEKRNSEDELVKTISADRREDADVMADAIAMVGGYYAEVREVRTDGGVDVTVGEDSGPTLDATTILTEREEREAVYRHVFMGQTMADVGEELDVSGSTVSNIVQAYKSHTGTELEKSILEQFTDEDDPREDGEDREDLTNSDVETDVDVDALGELETGSELTFQMVHETTGEVRELTGTVADHPHMDVHDDWMVVLKDVTRGENIRVAAGSPGSDGGHVIIYRDGSVESRPCSSRQIHIGDIRAVVTPVIGENDSEPEVRADGGKPTIPLEQAVNVSHFHIQTDDGEEMTLTTVGADAVDEDAYVGDGFGGTIRQYTAEGGPDGETRVYHVDVASESGSDMATVTITEQVAVNPPEERELNLTDVDVETGGWE